MLLLCTGNKTKTGIEIYKFTTNVQKKKRTCLSQIVNVPVSVCVGRGPHIFTVLTSWWDVSMAITREVICT